MPMTRAKFRCNTVEQTSDQPVETQRYAGAGEPPTSELSWPRTYRFSPQYDASVPEDQRYARYTPSGSLKITVDNPAVIFNTGQDYYLDFTPVSEAPADDELSPAERAQRAYDAYGRATSGLTFQGDPLPAWDDLSPTSQQAWHAAAHA